MYSNFKAESDENLEKDGSFQTLAIEIFKFFKGLSTQIMTEILQVKPPAPSCTLWRISINFIVKIPCHMVLSQSRFLETKIWSIVPQEIKSCKSLDPFKKSLRKWKPICLCWLCESYLQYVGFLLKDAGFLISIFIFAFVCHIIVINHMFLLYLTVFCFILKNNLLYFFPS